MKSFSLSIQCWYRRNYRNLPWRNTNDPYKIWLSEVIMQQTKVSQGLPYYHKFIQKYPTLENLATAEEQEILKLWQGLGYYSRARNLHFAAKQILEEFNGQFPRNFEDIMKLKGIGEYTAAAIASFAFDLPYPVLDGNVFRVLSRYFNEESPIDTGEGKKVFKKYLREVFNEKEPAEFNQAIMELGALICKPKNPNCIICPLQDNCLAFHENTFLHLPVKAKKVKIKKRYFHYLVYPFLDTIQLQKRAGKDIWRNMYQFPLIEADKIEDDLSIEKLVKRKLNVEVIGEIDTVRHILTHQILHVKFWKVKQPVENKEIINLPFSEIERYPLPRLMEKFVEDYDTLFLSV